MRQSRRTNIGNKRNTIARRWRPWLDDERVDFNPDTDAERRGPVPPVDEASLGQFRLSLGEMAETPPPE